MPVQMKKVVRLIGLKYRGIKLLNVSCYDDQISILSLKTCVTVMIASISRSQYLTEPVSHDTTVSHASSISTFLFSISRNAEWRPDSDDDDKYDIRDYGSLLLESGNHLSSPSLFFCRADLWSFASGYLPAKVRFPERQGSFSRLRFWKPIWTIVIMWSTLCSEVSKLNPMFSSCLEGAGAQTCPLLIKNGQRGLN